MGKWSLAVDWHCQKFQVLHFEMPQWGERHKRSNLHNRISTQLTFTWPDQKDKGKDKDILKEIQRECICIVDNPRRVAKWSDCLFCASPASELPSVFFCQQYLSAIRLQSLNRQSPIYQLQFKKARRGFISNYKYEAERCCLEKWAFKYGDH